MDSKRIFGAIVLAAGKGKRMKAKKINKVAFHLGDKPMVVRIVDLLKEKKIEPIIVVVGFAKKSVIDLLDNRVIFAEQKKRLGTGHAVVCALKKLNSQVTDVFVFNGDDSSFYNPQILDRMIQAHFKSNASITFLTVKVDKPLGLGRVIRDTKGNIIEIVEEKNATESQKLINEINTACYIFKVDFLRRYIKNIKKNIISKEYYLVDLIGLASKNSEKIETISEDNILWRGVNTKEELEEAQKLLLKKYE